MNTIIKVSLLLFSALFLLAGISACDEKNAFPFFPTFSIEDDKTLGRQVSEQIASDPAQFPVLDRSKNDEAYAYLDNMRDQILNSGEVRYKDVFVWEMHIIDADVLNAFATPGGYIYVYTGLIKFLDTADDLAGVMGHEIGHSDLRHSSRSMQKQYGVSVLLSILLGNSRSDIANMAGQLAGTVAGFSFSRKFEQESDTKSVEYLAHTDYACNGAASFFEKLEAEGLTGSAPKFLSTHPSPRSRVADIRVKANSDGCSITKLSETNKTMTYAQFQALFQ